MDNYKELLFLISSLFVIYFFKDIIITLIILVIMSCISLLLIKDDYYKDISQLENSENLPIKKENSQNKTKAKNNFIYNN
jgi:uncharacterized protein YxeA